MGATWIHRVLVLGIQILAAAAPCPQQCSCHSGDVDCETAGYGYIPTDLPSSTSTLNLARNRIHVLTADSFNVVRNLASLNLKQNQIGVIHPGTFRNMTNLQKLELAGNQLVSVTVSTFNGAPYIAHLDLSANKLQFIEGAFSKLSQLARLDLRDNRITQITETTFADLKNLRYLLLASNSITTLHKNAFKNLSKLMYLVMKENPLRPIFHLELKSFFLSYMDLSECRLPRVPTGLPSSLRYLQLRRNNITVIRSNDFRSSPNINILVLDENGLTQIQDHSFDYMTDLQQLWLNGNKLRNTPRPLPASLQRLLLDANQIQNIDEYTFPAGAILNTLSLMGNKLYFVSPKALHPLTKLVTLDLSNNKFEKLPSPIFETLSSLRTLTLSRNNVREIGSGSFHGLTGLRTFSLAYIGGETSIHPNAFRDLVVLKKLQLDSSPGIVSSIMQSNALLCSLRSVQELSMQSAEMITMRDDFPDFFPNLEIMHISSTRWHCDMSLKWFKHWLLQTRVRIDRKIDITCFTPLPLHRRPITSLQDEDFVPATTTNSVKMSVQDKCAIANEESVQTTPNPPHVKSTVGSTDPPTEGIANNIPNPQTKNPSHNGKGELDITTEADFHFVDNKITSTAKPMDPVVTVKNKIKDHLDTNASGSRVNGSDEDDDEDNEFTNNYISSHGSSRTTIHVKPPLYPTNYPDGRDRKGTSGPKLSKSTLHPPYIHTGEKNSQGKTAHNGGSKGEEDGSPNITVIAIATSVTIAIVLLIFIIAVVAATKKRKKGAYQNAIKYQNRNDVLYFMPSDGNTSDGASTTTSTTGKDHMALVPGRDIAHEGPLRVYKWEDF